MNNEYHEMCRARRQQVIDQADFYAANGYCQRQLVINAAHEEALRENNERALLKLADQLIAEVKEGRDTNLAVADWNAACRLGNGPRMWNKGNYTPDQFIALLNDRRARLGAQS